MRAAISLLVLLFSMCGAQTRSTQTEVRTESQSTGPAATAAADASTQLDVSAELKELRDMVHKQEIMLVELRVLLAANQNELQYLKKENGALETRLAATEIEVEKLQKISEESKVAFSAGLTDSGYIESGSNNLNLVFSKIFTNVGQAYSSRSGFFTAPVRGVYYFRFTVRDFLDSRWMYIQMCKNGERIMQLEEYDNDGIRTYLSSGLTLQLEVGDEVNMVLPAGFRLHDDSYNNCIFSGFLLFTL